MDVRFSSAAQLAAFSLPSRSCHCATFHSPSTNCWSLLRFMDISWYLDIDVMLWPATEAHDRNVWLAILSVHVEAHTVGKTMAMRAMRTGRAPEVEVCDELLTLGRRWALHCVPGLPLSVLWSDLKHVPHRLWHVDEKQALCEGLATWIVCQSTHRLADRKLRKGRANLFWKSVSSPTRRSRPTWRGGISRHELWGIVGNCDLGPW